MPVVNESPVSIPPKTANNQPAGLEIFPIILEVTLRMSRPRCQTDRHEDEAVFNRGRRGSGRKAGRPPQRALPGLPFPLSRFGTFGFSYFHPSAVQTRHTEKHHKKRKNTDKFSKIRLQPVASLPGNGKRGKQSAPGRSCDYSRSAELAGTRRKKGESLRNGQLHWTDCGIRR